MTYVIQRIRSFHYKELSSSQLPRSLPTTLNINYTSPNTHTEFCYNPRLFNYQLNINKFYLHLQHKAYFFALPHFSAIIRDP